MKTFNLYVRQLSLALIIVLLSVIATKSQTTTFTYQGKLTDDYNQPTGLYDLQFNLYDEISGTNTPLNTTPIILQDVQVTTGAFTVLLDFGNLFNGSNRYLEIGARPGDSTGALMPLTARQKITSSPQDQGIESKERKETSHQVQPELRAAMKEARYHISEPPALAVERAPGKPLSLRLMVEGDLRAELIADGQSIGFMDAAGQRGLRHNKLVALDTSGRRLPSGMRVEGSEVVLEVEDASVAYPLMVDPLIQQQKLTASDAAAGDLFGHEVSLSGDTAIVGAYSDDNAGGGGAGAAYVFTRSGGVWTQQQKLTASDAAAGDGFGFSVSVSGDTAVIGSINARNSVGQHAGAAYVFARSAGVWTQQQRLQPADVALNDGFGYSVSLSGDTTAISSVADDNGGAEAGSAYVFTRSGGVWTQQQRLQASDAKAGANFGNSLSLSSDTVIIGAWEDSNAGGSAAGAAYVFTRSNGAWTQQQKLTSSDAAVHDFFGTSVSLSGDTAVVGAYTNDGGGSDAGSAYVFVRSGGVWTQQQRLQASDAAANDLFGQSVSVSGDIAIVSSLLDDNTGGVDAGSAYVFTRSGGVWTQQQKFQASDAAVNDGFGYSVSLSGDTIIVGAYQDDNSGGVDAGSAYVFVLGTTNVAPVVNAGPDQSAAENVTFNLTASFTDADVSDTHTGTVNWGDGSPTQTAMLTEPSGSNAGTLTASHTYVASGNYIVTVTVADSASGSGSDTLQVLIGSAASGSYIQNTTTQQANSNFNISGNGIIGGSLSINGALNANGSGLTNLNAANITFGTIDNARLGMISSANIADSAITATKIADGAVTATKIGSSQLVKNLNGLTDNVNLAAGANVTITPSGNTLTISAASGGNFIQNSMTQQPASNFNISGDGTAGGALSGSIVNATTQFNIGGNRVLSTTGTNNIFAGNAAGNGNSAGSANSFVGANAGSSNTTGSNNTTVGSSANVGSNNLAFATAIGSNAVVSASNTIVLGRSAGEDTVQIPGNLNVSGTISGNVSGASFTNLNASNITTGTLADARLSSNIATLSGVQTFAGATTFAGGINGNGSGLTGLNASNITSGALDNTRLGVVGVANGGTGLTSAGASGNLLRSNGAGFTSSALTAADVPDLSTSYIRNQTGAAQSGGFNVSGDGAASNLTASSTLSGSIVNATTQFNIGTIRVLSIPGASNIFAGNGSGNSNTTGTNNSLIGYNAGYNNTTGYNNSFVGTFAGYNNTSGLSNSFFGLSAGRSNTTGGSNAFFGTQAGYSTTTANFNSFFGTNAGLFNTTGFMNAFVGQGAGFNNVTGNSNVFVGLNAASTNTAGSNSTVIGANANVGVDNLSYATAIGAEAVVSSSNTVALGRSAGQDTVLISGLLKLNTLGTAGGSQLCRNASNQIAACSSSLRYKTNVAPFTFGLDLVRRLRPITFTWKDGGMKDLGFGAEDVAKINPLLVTYNGTGEVEGVKYDRISAVLVNAVKQQQTQIEDQQTQLSRQQTQIEAQEQKLKQQQTAIDGLRKLLCQQNPKAHVCR